MGAFPPPRRRGARLALGAARGREGRAARGARTEELEAEEMARRAAAQGMKRDTLLTIKLPVGGGTEEFPIHEPGKFDRPGRSFTRKALTAAHVVADPLSTKEPWLEAAIDWDATLAYRRHLWSWGFGVAEAMDTAQRGMGLDWKNSLELIRRTVAEGGGFVASGAGTDHLPAGVH